MTSMLPSSGPKVGSRSSEIERFRARQRRRCRGQAVATSRMKMEKLDIDNGRSRKISANWQQQRIQCCNQDDDGIWSRSAGTEMHLGYNAFDFSASPEAFYDVPEEHITTKLVAVPGRLQGIEELPVEDQLNPLEQQTGTTHKEHGQEADYVYGFQQHKHVGSDVSGTLLFWGTDSADATDF
ncbi:hypothetical protein KXD40_002879 [Peronospora effusa]|uniref:Uncharacterized protein n=1 Tax=Peronospora effusa TaxID=542832 RepID=A0A3M6VUT4_9STRA|nr:hypothetical protein DD238_004632 [Peronospora effusa]RQM11791.1 hypothetical protein DD237_005352 [Peronospora effusa]UIZ29544.1 hypothetical protein KXD40_002879 [Peronospora effusa]CAI5701677.1 unnamed protein product [Peronospora effusa]